MGHDVFTTCRKCGKSGDKKYIIIAYDFVESIPLLRSESASKFETFCIDCGMKQLIADFTRMDCSMWIGFPSMNKIGKRIIAVNFKSHIVS